ncbi:Toluene efflux pump periplasmic linker protein TtgG [Pseudomonas sp. Nvir]|nr:Toluene efflux pump periplasmic linker protein TtgG [Pseudomonas sp. Nvir]
MIQKSKSPVIGAERWSQTVRQKRPSRALHIIPLTALLLITGCGEKEKVSSVTPPPDVGVYTVRSQPLTLTTDLPGRTSAFRVAEVRPQVSGILQKRSFIEGTEVKLGQQLYQIDPRTYEAQLRRAEANRTSAENLARRYETLLKTKAVSKQQYDDALAAWKQAEADYQIARIDVQYTRVLSPISGRIGRSTVTEGALVTNGQAQSLATVTQLDPIYVDVTQPITKLLGLQKALESGRLQNTGENQAEVSCGFHAIRPPSPLSSGQAFHGHLATCSTAIRPGSRSAATQGGHC